MTKDILPDLSSEPLAVRTLYPNPEYFQSWNTVLDEKRTEVESAVDGADIVGITHTDADGYGCEVMLREAFPKRDVRVITASESGPLTVDTVGTYVKENAPSDADVYIMDLAPNTGEGEKFITPFHTFESVTVIDHHEWEPDDRQSIERVAEVHHDTDRCATQITHDVLIEEPREEISELADLTADHDLWLKEIPERSDALSDLTYHADREEYIVLARENGADVIDTDRGRELIDEAQRKRERKTALAIKRATFHDINGYRVAVTYGDCAASDVGDTLREEDDVDLACVIFPNGKLSFRSADDTPIARDVATRLGGGGHPCAAGAKPDFVTSKVDYTTHWATKGSALNAYVREVIRDVTTSE